MSEKIEVKEDLKWSGRYGITEEVGMIKSVYG